jgi:hypothetical protein
VRSCSGLRISTPLTPNLLRAARNINTHGQKMLKIDKRKEKECMPAMCSLKEPCKARTPTTAML